MSRVARASRRIQRHVGRVLAVVVILLLANSLFLYTERLPDGVVGPMLRVHEWLGYALSVLVPGFFIPHILTHRRHRNGRAKGIGIALVAMLLVGCGAGLLLAARGQGADTRTLLRIHEISFAVAIGGYLVHRLSAYVTPVLRGELMGLTAALTLMAGLWSLQVTSGRPGGDGEIDPSMVKASFGASRVLTDDGHFLDEDDLRNSDYCAECHEEIADQWEGSLHRFSSQNDPFYEKTLAVMQRQSDPEQFQFCGGCHDPLVLLTGHMDEPIDPATTNAQEGITCLGCHAITEVRDRIGNAGYVIAAPEHYPYFGSDDPEEQETNRRLIRTKPEKHKADFLKPFHRTSEFCLTCHKTHLPETVNDYRWKRGPNDFDAWHDSAVGTESALTFYDSEGLETCQDCHMPEVPTNDPAARDGMTRDHSFPGANTAMAILRERPDWFAKTEALLQGSCSVDVFAAFPDHGYQGPDDLVVALDQADLTVPAGSRVTVAVVVRNRRVGHAFPTGTTDLNEPWLQFEVVDESGQPILASGMLDDTGRLDPAAHRFVSVLLTREGRLVDIHNVEEFYTALYANLIPLGQSDVVRYSFTVPERAPGTELRLRATLNYRKFSRQYTEFALGTDAAALPVTVIDEDEVSLTVGDAFAAKTPLPSEELGYRYNDFGIGHLRQGDTRTAAWAFERFAGLVRDDPNGWVNLARCYLQDGAYPEIEPVLRKADAIRPGYPKAAYFLGRLRNAEGRFEEAVFAYDVTLEAFPNDREALNAKGLSLFKLERFEEAAAVFERTLEVDPENLTANTFLFRCHRSLGNEEMAGKYEAAYLRYRTEVRETAATELYRRNNPYADVEANAQHVHELSPYPPDFDHPDEYRPSVLALWPPDDGRGRVVEDAYADDPDGSEDPGSGATGPYGAPLR